MRTTEFSPCRKYRYTLWREWGMQGVMDFHGVAGVTALDYLMVIGLNPSTADETKDDATIRRCIDFAKRWGYGGLCMTNLFAWRDTKPDNMRRATNPIGPDNNEWLRKCGESAGMILAAWGKHGSFQNRHANVSAIFPNRLYCLRRNQDGTPQHPLYVPAETKPILLFR